MNTCIRLPRKLVAAIHHDLHRSHPFAYERVGFISAGATRLTDGQVMLLGRDYLSVEDGDYVKSTKVGAMIGAEAMRKAIQWAYASKSALLHVHTHGGKGRPEFSSVDTQSAFEFVPGFFNALPRTPHGILVLSNDSAKGLLWSSSKSKPYSVENIIQVGAPLIKFGQAS
jgi:hypothetical protein